MDVELTGGTESRSEARRRQILDAAADCFRRYGFHAATITNISEAAGMSAGHIYHFFPNKEAIVRAIIEQNVKATPPEIEKLFATADILEPLLDRLDIPVDETTDPRRAALELEILAEATRNPQVLEALRAADVVNRERFRWVDERIRAANPSLSQKSFEARAEVLMALFSGLFIRAIVNPQLDKAAVTDMLRVIVRTLMEA
ncbi:TetR/AcrR family transcriptional regulator [bacterium]|nr:TetR/AcrR family transcriptional regulator [bacterium]